MIHISTLIHVSSVFTIMRSMVALKSDFSSSFNLNFNCIVYMPSYKHHKIHSKAVLSNYPTKHQGRFHISTWILIYRVSVQYNVAKNIWKPEEQPPCLVHILKHSDNAKTNNNINKAFKINDGAHSLMKLNESNHIHLNTIQFIVHYTSQHRTTWLSV